MRQTLSDRRFYVSSKFQSHAGSIEAENLLTLDLSAIPFQSHAGSIEAIPELGEEIGKRIPFQSHAGSIEAPSSEYRYGIYENVSIPRWFD